MINELLNDSNLTNQLLEIIENFSELESISQQLNIFGNSQLDAKASKVIEAKIKSVINMRITVELVHQMKFLLTSSNCESLNKSFNEYFEELKFEKLLNEINQVIEEQSKSKSSLSIKINKCFAIKVFSYT